jgi:hypothetical protein
MSNQPQINAGTKRSDSSDTIAMILEIVFGLFGILGIGWLYAGNWLVAFGVFGGFIVLVFIELGIATATLGFASCVIVPLNIAIAAISGLRARDYVRNSGATGSIAYVIIGVIIGVTILCGGTIVILGGLAAIGDAVSNF